MSKIAIGNDHAGVEMKYALKEHLEKRGYEVVNCGTDNTDSYDYPLAAKPVGELVRDKKVDFGVLICGSGVGISIAANKIKGIRAANVTCVEHAKLVKQHNNANIICFGARFVTISSAIEYLDEYIKTEFEGGRHQRRVDEITEIENKD